MTDLLGDETPQPVRRSRKSPAAFRTISEVAAELEVPAHVLRFWESRFASVKPLKRGGGRRYYRPEDLDLLRRIKRLLYEEGYTIKGAQKALRDPGREGEGDEPGAAAGLPEGCRAELREILGELRRLRSLLAGAAE